MKDGITPEDETEIVARVQILLGVSMPGILEKLYSEIQDDGEAFLLIAFISCNRLDVAHQVLNECRSILLPIVDLSKSPVLWAIEARYRNTKIASIISD